MERLTPKWADLQAALAVKEKKLADVEASLAAIPAEREHQTRTWSEAKNRLSCAREMVGQMVDLGPNNEDLAFFIKLGKVRTDATDMIRWCL